MALRRRSLASCQQSGAGSAKAVRPTEFQAIVRHVTALQRLERLAQQSGRGHLSPQELLVLRAQITRLRTTIPSGVLNSYETVKRSDSKAFVDSQLFPLMVLLSVIAVWAGQRPGHSDSQDYPGRVTFRVRRIKWPSHRRSARYSLAQQKRST